MKIELNDSEIYEIISKYTNIPFGIEDGDKAIISEGAVREAILCGCEVIHKEDMVGQDWSYYERLRKKKSISNRKENCLPAE